MTIKDEYVNPQKSFKAFSSLVKRDYPYELKDVLLEKKEVKDIFIEQFEMLIGEFYKYNVRGQYYRINGKSVINLAFLPHYLILSYRFARGLHKNNIDRELCESVYYSQRVRTGTDLYYTTKIGKYIFPVHPIASVINSNTVIGDGFRFYHGVTIGHSPAEDGTFNWPVIGDGVTMYPGSAIFGKCKIGDNVLLSVGTRVLNLDIPSNSVVFGQGENIVVKPNRRNNLSWLEL